MQNLTENTIEQSLIELLVAQGYTYRYWPDIATYSENPQREWFDSVVLENQFKESLRRLNPDVPESARVEAYQKIINLWTNDMMENNEKFHKMLTDGVTVEYFKDWISKWISVKLIDIQDVENNTFWVVNQLVIKENNIEKRLDVVVFVNWLPLVVIELKNATDEKATLEKAFTQIQNYKKAVPTIFNYNALCVISDGIDARTSSVSAPFSRYLARKSPEKSENWVLPELQILANRMLDKEVLLKLIRYNTVFENEEVKDSKTGLLSLMKIKKVAAYHQYYAVEKAVEHTLRATHDKVNSEGREGALGWTEWDRKVWVVRHTQWSWKSLSMVFYSWQIVVEPEMKNPTIVILTDRNDLDDQLFSTFWNCVSLLRQTPIQAESREHLKEILKVSWWWIVFTTIQKFSPSEWNVFDMLSDRKNIVVVADEAHRSQYGFTGKLVEKDEESMIKYGNAKYMRDALPNASFIGFTGTPIEKEDRDTKKVFGDYIDVYDIAQAVKDGATVPISYESRLVKIKLEQEAINKIDYAVEEVLEWTDDENQKSKKRNAQINAIVWHKDRLKDVAKDIVEHFEKRQAVFEWKAMIVCMTRQIAVDLYWEIVQLCPDWHDDNLNNGTIKVVMTSSSDDPSSFQPHHTTKQQRKELASRLKDPHDKLKMVIVQSMRLTGFDAPSLHTMYIDKKMQWANLMQAIARVNRVYKDKPGWLIVDYIGIWQDLRNAMSIYTESGGEWKAVLDISEVIAGMKTKFEIVEQMFHWFDYKQYFQSDVNWKLKTLLWAQNFILWDEKLKDRFLTEVWNLSKLFIMSVPWDEAEAIKDYVAFFQAVKSRINKFTPSGAKTDMEVQTAIKQIVDDALSSDWVVDIFEAAWVSTPSLSILSDEFLLEVKNMEQKNLAFELLKKLLNDEVRVRKTKNIVQWKKFSEMLSDVIKRYHNNQIDTAQVIEELSVIAKDMKLEDKKTEDLWLSPAEYAFYSILSENTSTKFLEDHKMKELIHAIVEKVRNNATVDWDKRDDVKATLRLEVKKVLIKYWYPPDIARMEADRVLEQSELLASELME